MLRARDLKVTIADHPVIHGISFDIAPGEILALTGESGSGKSMTALAVMGLLPDRANATGSLTIGDGENLLALPEKKLCTLRGREMGMIFQEPMTALNPVQTIGRQVSETIRIHTAVPAREAEIRAAEMLARVGLPPDRFPLSRYPHELSGGQRQRVGIAMAIALRPRLLIADEPTTALDVTTQAQILDLLKSLVAEEGMSLLMITHDLAVVSDMADRIAVMNKGEIVEEAPAAQLFREMRHPYTRTLFEASQHRADLPPEQPRTEPLLKVEGARRAYALPRTRPFTARPTFEALKGVDLTLHRGERLGLVGESGCGKSTLTRAILGLEPLQGGTITAFGQQVSPDMPAATRAGLQVVFQDPYGSFNPRHRVRRLIAEPLHLLSDPPQGRARDEAVAEALTAVGLSPDDADRHIHAFSGGQRQRIAIARALILRPEVILFDEAVSALDVRVRAQILDLIADLSRDYGLAWLFISHDLTVVRSITDRVLVMQEGRIVEEGPTAQILDAPTHAYTRKLVAAAPRLPEIGKIST
ncbi:ABC transporter ATP-binding protein [Allosediminivita pacifica]|uniref:ABC transporter ATP-binding protein n=1 Tax=Allosediminivita pacifica TaxID=1267769 RepID=UPI001FCE5581|nr:dipeptide ABC transporter ATP-binding protein [Allosediminivita pacifica]